MVGESVWYVRVCGELGWVVHEGVWWVRVCVSEGVWYLRECGK